MRTFEACLLAVAIGAAASAPADAQVASVRVLTALPATYSMASALAKQTSIVVENVPERPRPMAALGDYLETRADQLRPQFETADAVITIGKLWSRDPLFTAVRHANIRVVDIDASRPWSTTLEGISVAEEPHANVPWAPADEANRTSSVYYWLSPANGARSAEIVAADLERLSVKDAEQIRKNLAAYRQRLLDLKLEFEVKFASLADTQLLALAPEFVYLTSDMGLFVGGYFFKQDVDWTEDDATRLTTYLKEHDIGVVVHKWDPSPLIRAAIERGGARLVVLDTIELGVPAGGQFGETSYLEMLRTNLQTLYDGLAKANQ
ncbi:MAG: metal ABC transporter solute-binding protein, Zn/Mn family [Vicinamibacterales bacterium]